MPIYRLQCSFGADTAFPRDRFVFTPHFNVSLPGADVQALCDDLAAGLQAWFVAQSSPNREISVKGYDAQGTPPVFPVGDALLNPGDYPASGAARELAICLSFYSERNRPRQRGRLYIPHAFFGSGVGLRPGAADRGRVGELATIFANLGGTDVDWVVFSRADNAARSVSDWWVDDEWDIIRSRGLRPTTRLAGTVDE